MKASYERTAEEQKLLRIKQTNVLHAISGVPKMELFTEFERCWAADNLSYQFRGSYSPRLVELLGRRPDAEELIIIVNGSIMHAGASCIIADNAFRGRVNV